jgi:hypothetical protein
LLRRKPREEFFDAKSALSSSSSENAPESERAKKKAIISGDTISHLLSAALGGGSSGELGAAPTTTTTTGAALRPAMATATSERKRRERHRPHAASARPSSSSASSSRKKDRVEVRLERELEAAARDFSPIRTGEVGGRRKAESHRGHSARSPYFSPADAAQLKRPPTIAAADRSPPRVPGRASPNKAQRDQNRSLDRLSADVLEEAFAGLDPENIEKEQLVLWTRRLITQNADLKERVRRAELHRDQADQDLAHLREADGKRTSDLAAMLGSLKKKHQAELTMAFERQQEAEEGLRKATAALTTALSDSAVPLGLQEVQDLVVSLKTQGDADRERLEQAIAALKAERDAALSHVASAQAHIRALETERREKLAGRDESRVVIGKMIDEATSHQRGEVERLSAELAASERDKGVALRVARSLHSLLSQVSVSADGQPRGFDHAELGAVFKIAEMQAEVESSRWQAKVDAALGEREVALREVEAMREKAVRDAEQTRRAQAELAEVARGHQAAAAEMRVRLVSLEGEVSSARADLQREREHWNRSKLALERAAQEAKDEYRGREAVLEMQLREARELQDKAARVVEETRRQAKASQELADQIRRLGGGAIFTSTTATAPPPILPPPQPQQQQQHQHRPPPTPPSNHHPVAHPAPPKRPQVPAITASNLNSSVDYFDHSSRLLALMDTSIDRPEDSY